MKRFLIGAVAAAALAMPAGASATELSTTTTASAASSTIADRAIPPCPTTNLVYCAKYWVSSLIYLDGDLLNQCTTPVMPCVQQAVDRAFTTVDAAVALARYYAYYAVDQIDDPPPIQEICYLIWGQPCASALF